MAASSAARTDRGDTFKNACEITPQIQKTVNCPWDSHASYSNGALHWCDTATRGIAAFDLAKEKIFFLELSKLIELRCWTFTWLALFDYQGSLCACDGKSIWVMSEYGNAKSWVKSSTPLPEKCSVPVVISRLGEVVYSHQMDLDL